MLHPIPSACLNQDRILLYGLPHREDTHVPPYPMKIAPPDGRGRGDHSTHTSGSVASVIYLESYLCHGAGMAIEINSLLQCDLEIGAARLLT